MNPREFREVIYSVKQDPEALLLISGPTRVLLVHSIRVGIPSLLERTYGLVHAPMPPHGEALLYRDTFYVYGSFEHLTRLVRDLFGKSTVLIRLEASISVDTFPLPAVGLEGATPSLVEDIKAVMEVRGNYRHFGLEPNIEWSMTSHSRISKRVRDSIKAVVMTRVRRESTLARVPRDLMYEIFVQLQRLYWE